MTKRKFGWLSKPPREWARGLAVISGLLVLGLLVMSCRSVHRAVVVLPEFPEAKYIGSKECDQCHGEIYKSFQTADHARLLIKGPRALEAGCESCHGPCSVHSESGGETKPPYAYSSGRPQAKGSVARPALLPARTKETVCFECHAQVRGLFNLPSHHPVPEGKMTCIQCHPPHKGSARLGGGMALRSANDTCTQCHPAQRGPYVFEHEALRQGCVTCHSPHGSVNPKMLNARNANLCLQCHFQQIRNGKLVIGGSDHSLRLSQGTCWSGGCHEAVHGSRVNSSLRF